MKSRNFPGGAPIASVDMALQMSLHDCVWPSSKSRASRAALGLFYNGESEAL